MVALAASAGGSNEPIPGYEILRQLGKGAMATVYQARQLSLDRIVAIKVFPRKMSENADFVKRFFKEGGAAACLSHRNIVKVIDLGSTTEKQLYLVMEYAEGETPFDLMAPPPFGKGGKLAESEALEICIEIAGGLSYAHQHGLIHRDVKPKNILLTTGGVAKLADLGLVRPTDDCNAALTGSGPAYGTPYYISPEQIRGDSDIDARTDIYSLGATMYHLMTGRTPFEGETPSAVLYKHLKAQLVPANRVNKGVPADVSRIIDVAMSTRATDRYPFMALMLKDMLACQRIS